MPLGKRAYIAAIRARSLYRRKYSPQYPRTVKRKVSRRAPGLRARLGKYNLHSYIRWATPDSTTHSAGNYTSYTKAFGLSETINSSELTALYDQYMVKGVKVMFQLINNPDATTIVNNTATANQLNFYPKLWFVRDYDNVATESVDEIRQRNNAKCVVLKPDRMYSYYIRPAVRNQVYLDGVTTATSPMWNQWLDCSNSTVPHYGIKWAIATEGFGPSQTWTVRVEYKYYLKFKNAR